MATSEDLRGHGTRAGDARKIDRTQRGRYGPAVLREGFLDSKSVRGGSMEADVVSQLDVDFAAQDRAEAARVLKTLEGDLGNGTARVIRCVLFLSRGEMPRLLHYANSAREDFRDVLYWAEYDEQDQHVRDFTRPFPTS